MKIKSEDKEYLKKGIQGLIDQYGVMYIKNYMERYIVLTEDGSCGHKHRSLKQAMKCYNHFDRDRNVLLVEIPENRDISVSFIDHQLHKFGDMREIARAIENI